MDKPDFLYEKNGKTVFLDPRPDLGEPKESMLFGLLLMKAWKENPDLAMLLHGFRCQGTKLVVEESSLKLQPVIGNKGWVNQADYDSKRQELIPYTETLKKLMREIRGCLNGQARIAS